jgi:hypothetical protein
VNPTFFIETDHYLVEKRCRHADRAPLSFRNVAASTRDPYEGRHDPSGHS